MDLQQTVQDLAEAWVAASTDTSFSRTQLQVYGSGGAQGEGAEEGTEPSTSGEGDFSSANPMSTPSSPPPHGLPSGDSLASSHSRKRKQSSPQPRREGSEPAAAPGLPDAAASTNKGNPHRQNVSKIQNATFQPGRRFRVVPTAAGKPKSRVSSSIALSLRFLEL
ncbi:uncharacterized protein LOC115919710 isoform X2 [Strongylocentrotus purpuratus]|uniref:Uncharacterized protein n=1 Tax=Strongylocentrotus purpuratus TaxID=7668 RepID=A0A7M7N0Z4_STRPU|nr:uncharacterized protein LOC115919710 isoform X2 [Strongylocentrotus purpuratus]